MRNSQSSVRPLRIVVHGFTERAYAMLALLLSRPDWNDCTLVGQGQADLGIVDLDTPAPDRTWREYRNRHPDLPSLVLSAREQQRDNARFLRKPVGATTLRVAIDAMREQAAAPPPHAPMNASAEPLAKPPAANRGGGAGRQPPEPETFTSTRFGKHVPANGPVTLTRAATVELDREIEETNCGSAADVNLADLREWAKITYDPAGRFQGLLAEAIATARDTGIAQEILGLPAPLRVLPGRHMTIETTLKMGVLRSLCVIAVQPSMYIAASAAPVVAGGAKPASATAMLWQVALWTARGRLCRGIEPTTRVRLQHWPNFTRVAETPHAMRIAAVLSDAPRSAQELCADLDIAQRYVFSFISAAATMPQLVIVAPAAARPPTPAAPREARATPPRSLLARILGRLVAGA